MTKKKVLVAGGAGFIGSQVNKMLHEAGYDTIVLDNLSRGNINTVLYGTFIEGDISDTTLLNKIFSEEKIDAVMHFAAFLDVGESVQKPYEYYKNNVLNTLNLLNCMREHKVNNFIFSSSAANYGTPHFIPISEDHPCNPINPYGRTKLIVENILEDFSKAYGLHYTALRYFNAAGGDPDGEIKNYNVIETNLIPIVLKNIKMGRLKASIFGTDYPTRDGTCIRDYIHIYDLGKAHILAMERLMETGRSEIYNLGNGNGYSVREVIESIQKVTGCILEVSEVDRRPGDPPELIADAQKAVRELNWETKYPNLEDMIVHSWRAMDGAAMRLAV